MLTLKSNELQQGSNELTLHFLGLGDHVLPPLSQQELKARVNAFWSAYRELPNRIAVIRMAHELPARDRQRMVAQMERIESRIEFFVSALRDDA